MTKSYTYITEPLALLSDIPADSIVSRTLLSESNIRLILFGFATDQELTEHKTPMHATIQILAGEGVVTLGEETIDVQAGALIYMPPNLPHSVQARTDLYMLLTMMKDKLHK